MPPLACFVLKGLAPAYWRGAPLDNPLAARNTLASAKSVQRRVLVRTLIRPAFITRIAAARVKIAATARRQSRTWVSWLLAAASVTYLKRDGRSGPHMFCKAPLSNVSAAAAADALGEVGEGVADALGGSDPFAETGGG